MYAWFFSWRQWDFVLLTRCECRALCDCRAWDDNAVTKRCCVVRPEFLRVVTRAAKELTSGASGMGVGKATKAIRALRLLKHPGRI